MSQNVDDSETADLNEARAQSLNGDGMPPAAALCIALDNVENAARAVLANDHRSISVDLIDIAAEKFAKVSVIMDKLRRAYEDVPRDARPLFWHTSNFVSWGMDGLHCKCGHVFDAEPVETHGPCPDLLCPGCGGALFTCVPPTPALRDRWQWTSNCAVHEYPKPQACSACRRGGWACRAHQRVDCPLCEAG